jgi:hypothetical protein
MTQQQTPRPTPRLPDPGQREQSPKLKPLWLWILLGVVIAVVLAYVAGNLPATSTTHTVVYEVAADTAYGSGRTGTVTMQTANGTSQSTTPLPATFSGGTFNTGDFAYVSVQNGQGLGSVTCRITVDGVVVSENTSSGGYTIATCQGKVS